MWKGKIDMLVKNRIIKCLDESGIVILEEGSFDNMDSLKFISMIVGMETEFGIEIPDEYLLMNTFTTIEDTVQIIDACLQNESV